jgi:hypothetical protein
VAEQATRACRSTTAALLAAALAIGASPARKPEVQVSVRSKAGKGILWVHQPAEVHVLLRGTWPSRSLAWELQVEGLLRASGTVAVSATGQPQKELFEAIEVSDEDYASARGVGAPEWLKGDPGPRPDPKSTRRRLRFELLVRDEEKRDLVAKGDTDVMIEPVPVNERE